MKLGLVVHESRFCRQSAKQMLESFSFRIAQASDGVAALIACVREMPDLILFDQTSPFIAEDIFLRTLRSLPDGDRPKVIFCAGVNDSAHIAAILDAGADDYLMKPLYTETIRLKLAQIGL